MSNLQRTFQGRLELMEHEGRLFSRWHVRPTFLQNHLPLLYKVGNARPLDLDIYRSVVGGMDVLKGQVDLEKSTEISIPLWASNECVEPVP